MIKKKFLYVLLISLALFSCSESNKTSVVVLSCQDSSGNIIQESVTLTVGGNTKIWIPGSDPLEFEVDMGVDQGFITINAQSENYRLISPSRYDVEKSKGLELVLSFERSKDDIIVDPVPLDIVGEEVEKEEEAEMVAVNVEVNPSNAEVQLTSVSGDSGETFSGSASFELLEGVYRWSASSEGYEDRSGRFTVDADQSNNFSINLEEIVLENGSLVLMIEPGNSRVTLRNLETGEENNINTASSNVVPLYPGQYRYTVEAPDHLPQEGTIRIREADESELFVTLLNRNARNLLQEANQVQTVNQAQQLLQGLKSMNGFPSMDMQTRDELFEALVDVGMVLYDGGERNSANELFELLYAENSSNVKLRLQFGAILIRSGEYDRGREMLRAIYGQLQNLIPRESREEVTFEARYRHAESYYREFRNLPSDDFDSREIIGARAISELEDVTRRYETSEELSSTLEYEQLYYNASDWNQIIRNELGL